MFCILTSSQAFLPFAKAAVSAAFSFGNPSMIRFIALFVLLLLQAGCVTTPSREPLPPPRQAQQLPPPPPSPPEKRIYSRPDTAKPPVYHGRSRPEEGGAATGGAVLALLTEADRQLGAGQTDAAVSTLERAVRIKPKSAELWHKLARARLRQRQPDQAENLAKKSNVLARGEPGLTRRNWAIIAQARRLKGDEQGAQDAERRAEP
jgi:tetratricopeptide (TPR) repeat protein